MKRALITGGTSGIGKQTALSLAKQDYELILAARDPIKGERAVAQIQAATPGAKVSFTSLDTTDFSAVRQFAEQVRAAHQHIDVLILNAGLFTPKTRLSQSGHEYMFAATHLGHFLLTHELLKLVQNAPDGRIVVTSSVAHWAGWFTDFFDLQTVNSPSKTLLKPFAVYGRSKLANLLFVRAMRQRVHGVTTNAFHPGGVKTDIWRDTPSLFNKLIDPFLVSEEQGAQTQIWLATDPQIKANGEFFTRKKPDFTSPQSKRQGLIDSLWEYSMEELNIEQFGEVR